MTYCAYLDELGHVDPDVARADPKYRTSPVFGPAGFALPVDEVRGFGTWCCQRKYELLSFEINRSGKHPAEWEKKGSSFYTVTNVRSYPELRRFTNRLLNEIKALGGFVYYVGIQKTASPGSTVPTASMQACLCRRSNGPTRSAPRTETRRRISC